MGNIVHSNNASALLASGITNVATSITVGAGEGALFPTVGGGLFAKLTIEDALGNLEIVHLTAKSGDVLTVVRAQEGTAGFAFSAGARVENRVTAGTLSEFVQKNGDNMTGQFGAASGSVSAPGWSWSAELNAGWYRAGAGDFRFSIGAADMLELTNALFTSNVRMRLERALPGLDFYETDAPADEKQYTIQSEAGELVLRTRDDSGAGGAIIGRVLRTGTAVDEIELNAALFDFNGPFDQIDIGNADTSITRVAAGRIAVEGAEVPLMESGSYTGTMTGLTTSPTGTVRYERVGNVVTLHIPMSISGVSNSTAMTITGALPASCQPARAQFMPLAPGVVTDNGAAAMDVGVSISAASSTLTFMRNGSASGFTASGTKGLSGGGGATVTYIIT